METPNDGTYPYLLVQLSQIGGIKLLGPEATGAVLAAMAKTLSELGYKDLAQGVQNLYRQSQMKEDNQ